MSPTGRPNSSHIDGRLCFWVVFSCLRLLPSNTQLCVYFAVSWEDAGDEAYDRNPA